MRYLLSLARRRVRFSIRHLWAGRNLQQGKITLATILIVALAMTTTLGAFFEMRIPSANAANVQTTLTVLNTPPQWTVDAQEAVESSTSTPTLAGYTIAWNSTGTDSNNDSYFLLICKTSAAPSATNNGPPSCGGGIANQWAISATTTSAAQATAATTTKETFPFNAESNAWYAWICDFNVTGAQCNLTPKQGSGITLSPFVIDHPPVFTAIANSGPTNPGQTETWTATATDTDLIRGGDKVRLYVCKAQDFATSTCGAGGTWGRSTIIYSFNPATTTTISIPTQNQNYFAYVYVTDDQNLSATSSLQATTSTFYVKDVAPTVSSSTVSLVDTDNVGDLTLIVPHATSGPFKVQFTVVDNNSCLNASSTNEIASTTANVYRSGVTQASCKLSGDYNANSCYPFASVLTDYSCTQDVSSCTGASDSDATFTCTFSLWYNADPTDASTQFTAQNWLTSVQASDIRATSSPLTESSVGNDLDSFLAFNVSQSTIAYGGLQPGQNGDLNATTTDLLAWGNVGLDETLYGDTMCTNWSGADSCDAKWGPNPSPATSTIPIANQKAATSSVLYGSAFAYPITASTSPLSVAIHVLKTTVTSTPQTKNTFWAIAVPIAITLSGSYTGQNTITAVKSSPSFW